MRIRGGVLFASMLILGLAACGSGYRDPATACIFAASHAYPGEGQKAVRETATRDCIDREVRKQAATTGTEVKRIDGPNGSTTWVEAGSAADRAASGKAVPTINTRPGNTGMGVPAPAAISSRAPAAAAPARVGAHPASPLVGQDQTCRKTMTGGTGYACIAD
ncbi:hypothetical protein [Paracoccus sp. IB05]|uniref:hypothetical protein n=1 Tax=Paracoccus sp. IB05 TaxID=2779367 RepID=UPI0018E6FB84|nr:hypothetical protein [Paracoccus sp. IB05]MBJ2150442.1 hypothetical protein [Paracoccus sp. IB05]